MTGTTTPSPFRVLSLPNELIENIFSSVDSFSTAISLACTCSFMRHIFVTKKTNICLSILPNDPILNGRSCFASYYEQAITLYRAQQKSELRRQQELDAVQLALDAAHNADSVNEPDDDTKQDEDVAAAIAAPAVVESNKDPLEFSKPEEDPLPITSFHDIHAIMRNASIINATSIGFCTNIQPTKALGFSGHDMRVFELYADELVRGILYDLWTLVEKGEKLVQGYSKGYVQAPHHPTNHLLTGNMVHLLSHTGPHTFGFPMDLQQVVPRHNYLSNIRQHEVNLLISACTKREGWVLDIEMWHRVIEAERERGEKVKEKEAETQQQQPSRPESSAADGGVNEDFATVVAALRVRVAELEDRIDISDAVLRTLRREIDELRRERL